MDTPDYLQQREKRRSERLEWRRAKVMELEEEGFEVTEVGYDHFRINKLLDLFLVHNQYYDLKRREHGNYKTVKEFVKDYFSLRPVTRFEVTDSTPPPPLPQIWILNLFPSWRRFRGLYLSFQEAFRETQTPRVNPNTQIGQAFLKALDKNVPRE